jgi:uncharacterized protein (TIGR02302 family)
MRRETDTAELSAPLRARIAGPLRLTRAGLWAERLARAFWPAWSIAAATLAALSFGVQDLGPAAWARAGLGLAGVALLAALVHGLRRFQRPTEREALARIDSTLAGRPMAALTDRQALGSGDEAARALWAAHQARMAARAAEARPVAPDLRLSSRDPYALRYVALTALAMAVLFGSGARILSAAGLAAPPAEALAGGPSWEGWAAPPAFTGKPSLYLSDLQGPGVELPVGTRVQIRTYGEPGALVVSQSVGPDAAAPEGAVVAGVHDFSVARSGAIEVAGPGGRVWQVIARPDAAPTVTPQGEIGREADGRFRQGFAATDDYGVVAGQVTIALDLAAVDRRHGLAPEPEAVAPVVLDLPMPLSGSRAEVAETLVDDLSQHVLANLPVTMTFAVRDAAGQEGVAPPLAVVLPGRRFFDPLAAAIIEMRRDLMWTRTNAPRSVQILRAVTHRGEELFRSNEAGMRLRVALRELDAAGPGMSVETRDRLAEELWEIALLVEEGDLASALERLRRAQDRLDEAIRNGASPEEIDELMREMQEALRDYTRELAEEAQRNPEGAQSGEFQGQQMGADQLQQMLDELQRLMEEGRTAEAAELMEQLRQLMENMQVTEGQGQGQGQGQSPGQQAMRDLQDTLRDQQGLSDDSFRDLQQGERGTGDQPGDQQGQPPGQQGQGQQGEGQDGEEQDSEEQDGEGLGQRPGAQGGGGEGSLAERQRGLRQRLDQLQAGPLPGDGTEEGEAGRDALEEAERAMREAEEALRDGDLPGALDRQAEAMEAMREGMRSFGEAMAQEQQENQGAPQDGDAFGNADPNGQRDPLGREPGNSARIGSDRNMVQEDTQRRAQELLDELRRRSGEQERPDAELDYLRRLLEVF